MSTDRYPDIYCPLGHKQQNGMWRRKNLVNEGIDYKCWSCNEMFRSNTKWTAHISSSHKEVTSRQGYGVMLPTAAGREPGTKWMELPHLQKKRWFNKII
jgi:hypothetical protein